MSVERTPSPSSGAGVLAGKTALVTGAGGGGCGTRIAWSLAERGALVVINGLDRHRTSLEATRRSAEERGLVMVPVTGDVGDGKAVVEMWEEITSRAGDPDIVVHNAATSMPHVGVAELSSEQWHTEFRTIADGAFHLVRRSADAMVRHGGGRYVFISSSAALRGARGRSVSYSAAKAALHGLAAQVALELGPSGVTANVVAPSQIDTPRVRRGGRRDDSSMRRSAAAVPLGRVGTPDDLAGLVSFLSGPDAGYLTGQVFRLDGGSFLASPLTSTAETGAP